MRNLAGDPVQMNCTCCHGVGVARTPIVLAVQGAVVVAGPADTQSDSLSIHPRAYPSYRVNLQTPSNCLQTLEACRGHPTVTMTDCKLCLADPGLPSPVTNCYVRSTYLPRSCRPRPKPSQERPREPSQRNWRRIILQFIL